MVAVLDPYDGLDDEQRSAVAAPPGPVCVLAGAGTGKTRTITRRIARLVADEVHPIDEILAVTFTARAAGEMRLRLRALGIPGVQARTFHAAALKQLRYFWPKVIGGQLWPVLEQKMRLVAAASRRVGAGTDISTLRDLAGEIEWAKATLISPADFAAEAGKRGRQTPLDAGLIGKAFAAYEHAKTAAEQLDFDDLLLHTCAVLEENDTVASEFRSRYRAFVVDEYQDVTPLQQRLLSAWLGERDNITVVGDANQTIYSFAGAQPSYLLDFDRKYPHATVVKLERDYRSTPEVVTVANRVIAGARGASAKLRLRLRPVLPSGPAPVFHEFPDEPAEAAAVAGRCRALIDSGTPASEIAVLYRMNAQSEVYESALAALKVPYLVRGGERFFARSEIRQAMVALRSAAAAGTDLPLVPAVRSVLMPVGLSIEPPPVGALREKWDSLSELVTLAEELADADQAADLSLFARELEQRAEAQHAPTSSGVTLGSLHAAKGLEWTAVFLVGVVDGTLPIQHAQADEEVEEERRLFYVGVTRAKSLLQISWALSRTEGGRRGRRRSRFLHGLTPPSGRSGPGRCRDCSGPLASPLEIKSGRCSSCPSTADAATMDALRSWRKERASTQSVPAYVVFTDATLVAIAERSPTNDTDLLRIPGIGRAKLDSYGAEVLQILADHRSR